MNKIYLKNVLSPMQFDTVKYLHRIIEEDELETKVGLYKQLPADEVTEARQQIDCELNLFKSLPHDEYLQHNDMKGLQIINDIIGDEDMVLSAEQAFDFLQNDPDFTAMLIDEYSAGIIREINQDCRLQLAEKKKKFAFSEVDLKKSYKTYTAHMNYLREHFNDYYMVVDDEVAINDHFKNRDI